MGECPGFEKCMEKGQCLEPGGSLGSGAAGVLMKILYGARMARPDLLRAVQGLSRCVTKWTKKNDAELHRLVCYIHTTRDWKQVGWVGDPVSAYVRTCSLTRTLLGVEIRCGRRRAFMLCAEVRIPVSLSRPRVNVKDA